MKKQIILKSKGRYLVFSLLLTLNIFVNMDHGNIPAATKEISTYLSIDIATLGLFGSLAFFGSLIGKYLILLNIKNYL